MITINLVCVGNLKEKFSKDEEQEYLKRLSAFCKLNIIEIKGQNKLESVDAILSREGQDILRKLKGYCILCDINGKEVDSVQFAKDLEKLSQNTSCITFVVGGSFGVSDEVREKCQGRISFSKMTFPHNLFRIMLLEQLYRAFTILNGKTYHK